MDPRESPKAKSKSQRTLSNNRATNTTAKLPFRCSGTATVKKVISTRNNTENTTAKIPSRISSTASDKKTLAARNENSTATTPSRISTTASTVKKTLLTRNGTEKTPIKVTKTVMVSRQRTITVPKMATPKTKENKSVPMAGVTKSNKKLRQWKPKPAHSGVPVPEKMKKLLQQLQDEDWLF